MLTGLLKASRIASILAAVVVAGLATWELARVDWALDSRDRMGESTVPADAMHWRERLGDRPLDGAAFRGLGDRAAAAGDEEAAAGCLFF